MNHSDWWFEMTAMERVIHYNRNLPKGCTHKADLMAWPMEFREPWSYDPYMHIQHMDPHITGNKKCECQMCLYKIGQPDK